jgi:hypothetical protein
VNAHFQSGVAERRVRELQELGRTELIHAQNRWKEAIFPNLWPNSVVTGSDCHNEAPTSTLKRSPCEVFTNSKVMPNPMAWMPFGCPVHVLDNALQNTTRILNRWKHRSRVGVYLGRSPLHAATVALVLNLQTGHVSPQFHVQFDPAFKTVNPAFSGRSPISNWQAICGFTSEGPARAGGAKTTPPTEWIPTPASIPELQGLQELSQSEELGAAVDDDDQSTATIGSLEEEQFAGEEQTLIARTGTDVRWKDS